MYRSLYVLPDPCNEGPVPIAAQTLTSSRRWATTVYNLFTFRRVRSETANEPYSYSFV